MKDIFTDLYNKVLGFFRKNEKEEAESAKDVACNRLKVVLMQDRTNLTPELMDRMRKELVELLSRYVEMDKDALELGFEQEGNQMALMLSIPVVRAKDEAEIEATLAEEDAKAEENASEEEKDSSEENSEDEEPQNDVETESDEEEEEASDDIKGFDVKVEETLEVNQNEKKSAKKTSK